MHGPTCAYCLQPFDGAARHSCRRCQALYHPDCWTANRGRCAIYACEPVDRRARPGAPTLQRLQPAASGSWGGWVLIYLVLMVITQMSRLGSASRAPATVDLRTPSFISAPRIQVPSSR